MKFLLVIFALFPFQAFSQNDSTFSLIIKVIDADFKEPLVSVSVDIFGSSGSLDELTSDSAGLVRFFVHPSVRYKIWTHKTDYYGVATEISSDKLTDTITIDLKYSAGCKIYRLPEFRFVKNSAHIGPEQLTDSANWKFWMNWNENIAFEIAGYSSLEEDSALAIKRALAVKAELMQRGLSEKKLFISSFPGTYPSFPYREEIEYKEVVYLFKENSQISESDYRSFDSQKKELIDSLMRRAMLRLKRD